MVLVYTGGTGVLVGVGVYSAVLKPRMMGFVSNGVPTPLSITLDASMTMRYCPPGSHAGCGAIVSTRDCSLKVLVVDTVSEMVPCTSNTRVLFVTLLASTDFENRTCTCWA